MGNYKFYWQLVEECFFVPSHIHILYLLYKYNEYFEIMGTFSIDEKIKFYLLFLISKANVF